MRTKKPADDEVQYFSSAGFLVLCLFLIRNFAARLFENGA